MTVSMIHPRYKRIVGCVADNTEKYLNQALRLLQSWRWFGGGVSDTDFFVCVVDDIDDDYKKLFEFYNAHVRCVRRASKSHPPSNKLRFLALPEAYEAERVVLLDCDTIVVQDPSRLFDGPEDLMAKIADMPTVTQHEFVGIFSQFGVPLPPQKWRCTVRGEPTLPYFNAGVLSFSKHAMASLVPRWIQYNDALLDNLDLLGDRVGFCEQVSLSLAAAACSTEFKLLGNEMNFPTHFVDMESDSEFACTDPVIIHYHWLVDQAGYLLPSPYKGVNARIQQFNAKLRLERQTALNYEMSNVLRPVFIVGTMRSGTTLLAELLGQSPHVCHCPFELKDIWSRVGGIPMASAKTRDLKCPELDAKQAQLDTRKRLTDSFLTRMESCTGKVDGALFLTKNPHLCNKLPFVRALFPNARFIWIYRHLPQVVASLKLLFVDVQKRQGTWHIWPEASQTVRNRCWHAVHSEDQHPSAAAERVFPGGRVRFLAEYWLEANRAVNEFFSSNPGCDNLIVSEEALIAKPASVIAECLDYLKQPLMIPDGLEHIDGSRNSSWLSLLSYSELEELKIFVIENKSDIDSIFVDSVDLYLGELEGAIKKNIKQVGIPMNAVQS